MPENQFAEISKDLCTQVKVMEKLLKNNLFSEAHDLMSNATKSYQTLETLMIKDNIIQKRIVENRQKEIAWIHDAIQNNVKKTRIKSAKKTESKAS